MRFGSSARYLLVALSGAVLIGAACGGSSGGSSSSGSGDNGGTSGGSQSSSSSGGGAMTDKVNLSEFKIDPAVAEAKAGSTLTVQNTGKVAHDLVVADPTGKVLAKTSMINPGGTGSLALTDVKAGSYTIYCDVTGHRQSGMSGTLTVS